MTRGLQARRDSLRDSSDPVGNCVNCVLVVINLFSLVFGLLLLTFGLIFLLAPTLIQSYIQNYAAYYVPPILLSSYYLIGSICIISLGAIILIFAFCGCIGGCKKVSCLVCCYAIFLVSMLVVLGLACIVWLFARNTVFAWAQSAMTNSTQLYNPFSKDTTLKTCWDLLHTNYNCCGIATSVQPVPWRIWLTNTRLNMLASWTVVPDSCCISIPCHLDVVVNTSLVIREVQAGKLRTGDCYGPIRADFLQLEQIILVLIVIVIILILVAFILFLYCRCMFKLFHSKLKY